MNADLLEQLHNYAEHFDAAVPELELDDVRTADGQSRPLPTRRPILRQTRHRPVVVVAITAFLTLLVLGAIGVIGLLGGEGPEVIDAPPNVEIPLSNGDFETGDLTHWNVYSSSPWAQSWGRWFVYEDALTPPIDSEPFLHGRTSEGKGLIGGQGFVLFDPPQGDYAAVAIGDQPGLRILYRDFMVEGSSVLRATVFYNEPNFSPWRPYLTSTDDFRVHSPGEGGPGNQQYRIDLIDPAASIDSLADEDVLGTVFRTVDGDPPSLEPTEVVFDLSPWEGQTIRLRAVSSLFYAGIDDVRIEPAATSITVAQSDTVAVVKRMLRAFEENDPAAFRAEFAADAVYNNIEGEGDAVFSSAEWMIADFDGDGVASPFDADQFWMAFEPLIRGQTERACWSIAPLAPEIVECTFSAANAFTSTQFTATGEALPGYSAYWVRHFWLKDGKIVAERTYKMDIEGEYQNRHSGERVYAPGLGTTQRSQQEMSEAFQTYEAWVRSNHTELWSELFRDPVLSASLIYSPDAIAIHTQLIAEYLSR